MCKFVGTDDVDSAVIAAASEIADEYFTQIGKSEIKADHDDEWYFLTEELRSAMFSAACGVLDDHQQSC